MQWANDKEEHTLELFTRLADLEVLHGQLYKRYSNQIESARQCYKAISKGEKHVQDLKKDYDTQQVRANKVRKQVSTERKVAHELFFSNCGNKVKSRCPLTIEQ